MHGGTDRDRETERDTRRGQAVASPSDTDPGPLRSEQSMGGHPQSARPRGALSAHRSRRTGSLPYHAHRTDRRSAHLARHHRLVLQAKRSSTTAPSESMMNEPIRYESIQEPLDDEERELMKPDNW